MSCKMISFIAVGFDDYRYDLGVFHSDMAKSDMEPRYCEIIVWLTILSLSNPVNMRDISSI